LRRTFSNVVGKQFDDTATIIDAIKKVWTMIYLPVFENYY